MSGPSQKVSQFLLSQLGPSTQERYVAAMLDFGFWCRQRSLAWQSFSEEHQDYVLADYVHDLIDEGDISVQKARDLVAGLQKIYPRRKYITSSLVVVAWAKQNPPVQAPPMPLRLCLALVVLLTALGFADVALPLLLCQCALLRIGEALALVHDDLSFGVDQLVILLRSTKTGTSQRVVLCDPGVLKFVSKYLERFPGKGHQRLTKATYSKVRTWLTRGCAALGFADVQFRSHSFRRGGATELFMSGVVFSSIMFFGRWLSERSCRLYVQPGEAVKLSIERSHARHWPRADALARIGDGVFDII
jgi:integrase